jgi:hypothetical protein
MTSRTLRIALATLSIETNERAPSADHAMRLYVWVAREVAEVADRDVLGIDADVFEQVELFDG